MIYIIHLSNLSRQSIHLILKVCKPVPKMVPTVSCETLMKEIELKEICIDIDIQLPREECKQEEREDCRSEQKTLNPLKEQLRDFKKSVNLIVLDIRLAKKPLLVHHKD